MVDEKVALTFPTADNNIELTQDERCIYRLTVMAIPQNVKSYSKLN